MRDIVLTVVIGYLLLRAVRQAEIGAYLWTWLALMNPHQLSYGFAYSLPWAQAAAGITLVGAVFSKNRRPLPMSGGVIALLLLWAWMTVTSFTSINNSDAVWARWIFVSKINLMLLVTLMLLRGRKQIDVLVWVIVGSLGFFGVKGGIYTILTGGSGRVWGPPNSMVEENNALAVALIIILPLMYYLRQTATRRWLKPALAVSMLLVGVSILGSQSRGALLGLLVMAFFLGLKGKHPVRSTVLIVALVLAGIAFMPDTWSSRMETIQSYQQDDSAMSRLYTWRTLWNVAIDRPLVGAGFRADNVPLFLRYAPTDGPYAAFYGQMWVAHSIYFQALGEHGFIGLAVYLSMWIWVWIAAGQMAKQAARYPELADWLPLLARMCQVATIGFCVGGAFLSLMNFDLPFYIMGVLTLCQVALKDHVQGLQRRPVTSAAAFPAGQAPGIGFMPGQRMGQPE